MALAFVMMSDSAYRVDTIARLAQWRIDSFGASSYRKSDPFMIGKWNCLKVMNDCFVQFVVLKKMNTSFLS
ncbi:putative BTB/POZ domain-containing protein AtSIBP1 [Helianthus annuus]|nr:putative BTB/POZ domain-containing protein AtSIBP1 [Helianthus annuus]